MTFKTLATGAALAALMSMPMAAFAQEATPWMDTMMKVADANKDGMVTKDEFLAHMGKVWDEKHGSMMKKDTKMKAGMMDKTQFMTFVRATFVDPGKIGGN